MVKIMKDKLKGLFGGDNDNIEENGEDAYYKTSKEDQTKLEKIDSLTITAQFLIAEYVK